MVIPDFTDLLQFRHTQSYLNQLFTAIVQSKKTSCNISFSSPYSPENNTGLKKTKKILTSLLEFIII